MGAIFMWLAPWNQLHGSLLPVNIIYYYPVHNFFSVHDFVWFGTLRGLWTSESAKREPTANQKQNWAIILIRVMYHRQTAQLKHHTITYIYKRIASNQLFGKNRFCHGVTVEFLSMAHLINLKSIVRQKVLYSTIKRYFVMTHIICHIRPVSLQGHYGQSFAVRQQNSQFSKY